MKSLRTSTPGERAARLLDHLAGDHCRSSREAAECVRRVMVELASDAAIARVKSIFLHTEGPRTP